MTTTEVAVVGAGPYGLSAAAHLRARGLDVAIFGKPMSFWKHHMPSGMLLRSPYCASSIDGPHGLSLDDFQASTRREVLPPVPLERFIEYGHWVQRQVAPEVDQREIVAVEQRPEGGFALALADGDGLVAERVIVAAGIGPFSFRPPEFLTLPADVVSHTVDHAALETFAGKRVAVIGGGQSALESAALLAERGAEAEVFVRGPVRFVDRRWWLHKGPMRLLHNSAEIGPAVLSHLVTVPSVFTAFPHDLQEKLAARAIRPVGAAWLQPRLAHVALSGHTCVVRTAAQTGGSVRIDLSDGTSREVDNVLLATGYRIDIARYSFLSPGLVAKIELTDGYPRLGFGFESSVAGLHFVGAPAAKSFGPFLRFVVGTRFVGPRLSQAIADHGRRRLALSVKARVRAA